MNRQLILEMKSITKKFGAVTALKDMSFSVFQGEIHAICGENGAGKSTLMKILHGYYPSQTYRGDIFIEGKKVELKSPIDSCKAGIAMIYQEIDVLPSLTVAENIFSASLPTNRMGIVDFPKMYRDAYKYLEMINVKIDSKDKMGKLNTSQQQLVMFSKALAENAKILILDEPTSSLTMTETALMMEKLNELREMGVTCIYISHKLDEIVKIADRCTVIRDGESITTLEKKDFILNTIVSAMVGRDIEQIYPTRNKVLGEEMLRVEKLTIRHRVIKTKNIIENVSFNVKKGEILGLAGLVGSGRSEVINAVFGSQKKVSGDIYIEGKLININSPIVAVKNGVSLLTEDRHLSGLFLLDKDIKQNITSTILNRMKKGLTLDSKREKSVADDMMTRLSIKASNRNTKITSLSGGNQQKVSFGKCLATNPKILLLDEPTRGIDVGAKIEIYQLIMDLAAAGISIVVISSELPELVNICDRFIVISNGMVKGELLKCEAADKKIMEMIIS